MIISILISLSFLLMCASFAYLSHEDFTGDNLSQKIKNAIHKNIKVLIYNICAFVLMIALSFTLIKLYKSNTLIADMKIITLMAILVTVAVTDIRKQIIPNKIILIGIVFRVLYAVAELITLGSGYFSILKSDLLSLGLTFAMFLLGVLVVKNGIGMGDIKLIMLIGIFQGLSGVIGSLFFSLLTSFVIAIVMLITRKKTRKDSMEFAPAVLFGTVLSMFLTGM